MHKELQKGQEMSGSKKKDCISEGKRRSFAKSAITAGVIIETIFGT
jgi:hypothetical protein